MKVLLINPPSDFVTFKVHETLSLGYLAAALDAAGHPVEIYDCNFQSGDPDAVCGHVTSGGFEMVGFTTMIGKTRNAAELAGAVKRASGAFIVAGGYTATYEYELLLQRYPAIDAIVRGEGELVLPELASAVERGGDWRELPSVASRGDGGVRANPMTGLHMDLASFPMPWRSPHLDRIGLASILSSRGCYAKCSFCNIQEFYNLGGFGGIRVRSPRAVVEEMELVHRRHGIRKFLFIDDDMLGVDFFVKGRNLALAREIVERGLNVDFEMAGRANEVIKFEDVLVELKRAGLSRVYVGIESGSDTQLKRQRKGVRKEHNVRTIEILRRNGLGLDMGFIPFDPWTTPDEIVENMRFLRDMGVMEAANLNSAAVTMILYPGTALYERARQEGLFIRSDDFTYAYRFADPTSAALIGRIIYFIKRKPVLDAVDRFIGAVKADPELRVETTRTLDPAARHAFGLWTDLIERWCGGGESPDLEREIARVETLIENFCLSGHRLRSMRDAAAGPLAGVEWAGWAAERMAAYHRDVASLLHSLDGAPPPESAGESADPQVAGALTASWSDRDAAERLYRELVWQAHTRSAAAARRTYAAPPDARERLAVAGRRGDVHVPLDMASGVRPAGGGRVVLGMHLVTPEHVMGASLREEVTSQAEKTEASFAVALRLGDEARDAGVRVTRGWSDVEFELTPEQVPLVTGLVVRSTATLDADVEIRGRWSRTAV